MRKGVLAGQLTGFLSESSVRSLMLQFSLADRKKAPEPEVNPEEVRSVEVYYYPLGHRG